jgi:primase-polymerase (primpol)-like protein
MTDRPATDQRPTSDHLRNLRSSPPSTLPVHPERIPGELRTDPAWVAWRWKYEEKPGRKKPWTKPLVNPLTGKPASHSDPTTWSTIDAAIATMQRYRLPGIGRVLTERDPFFAIDLDHCRDAETGEINQQAQAIIDRFPIAYAEPSVTGTGIRLIGRSTWFPIAGCRRDRDGIEVYWTVRYVTISGNPLPGHEALGDCTDSFRAWHAETFPQPVPVRTARSVIPSDMTLAPGDDDILERARRSEKFRRLYDGGDMSDYADNWSDADLGELCHLVRAGADTPEQLDRIHRAGALMRDKWDTRRGASTYGETTISKALDGRVTPFRPAPPPSKTATCGDGQTNGTELPDDVPGLKALIVDLTRRVAAAEKRADVAEQRAEAAEKRAAMLSEVQSKATGIVGNGKLRNARSTGLVLSYLFANREAAGETGPQAINQKEMAKRAGCSDDALAKHLDLFDREGVIRKRTDWVPGEWVDADGVIHDGRRQVIIEPVGSAMTFVDNLVMLDPIRLKRDGSADKGWGGARECRDHPGAEVVITSEASCGVCGKRLGALKSERFDTLTAATEALDIEPTEEGASPQHAGIPRTSVVNHISRDSRTYHNDDAPPDSIAGAWQRGAALPGFEPSPPADRWTG